MRVGSQEEIVEATRVYIEPNSEHFLQNTGDDKWS
jgi:hypothetical protein